MNARTRHILTEYARPIAHMRQKKLAGRFGLMFGSGIGRSLGFPSWHKLIDRIASDPRVNGLALIAAASTKTSISQLLFQRFKTKLIETEGPVLDQYDEQRSRVQSVWHTLVHDALYRDVPTEIGELKERDLYLVDFLPLIKESILTINYNFDNTLQLLLSEQRTDQERTESRGFRTVWSSNVQLYSENSVIYHPNGYLPRLFSEKPSDELIFLEDSFGDQLIESASGHYATLSYHLAQNTCLLVGLSLDDATLKHLLRKNAKLHPGHVHYYVYFVEKSDELAPQDRRAIRDANFEVYNLVTLFLTEKEISALGRLLTMTESRLHPLADELGLWPLVYRYYLTGPVCVGKSTAVSHFRSLATYDEWLETRVRGMEKDPSRVDDDITRSIDLWVVQQWRLKNIILASAATGVHIIDRCPLDAFAFTPIDLWINKAEFTTSHITPGSSHLTLTEGAVILLTGDPEIMSVRAIKLQKDLTSEGLHRQQKLLRVVYDTSRDGIVALDTRNKSINRVSKDICRIIHMDPYKPCNLQDILDAVRLGSISPSEDELLTQRQH